MKKRVMALLMSVALLGTMLIGCGNDKNGSDGEKAAENETGTENGDAQDITADDGEVFKLTFTIHQPETTAFCSALKEWQEEVKEKSNGRLDIQIYYGGTLASAADAVEFVRQGGADICWNTVSLNASSFKYSNIMSMYGQELTNAQLTTYAYMKLCKESPAFTEEFNALGLKLLAAHGMTPSLIAGNGDKLETVEDFKGTSIMSISKTCISILDGFGAAVIGVTPADLYENFSKNVVQASLIDSSLYVSNKLYEQFSWMNTYNYNSALAFVVMNEDSYNKLPADLQQILMDEYETLSLACAKYTDEDLSTFVNEIAPQFEIEIYDAAPEVIEAVNEKLIVLVEEPWAADCESAGYDAAEIKSLVEQYIQEGREQYGAEYDWFE